MMMPQATEQYVQVLRVSVVVASLNGRIAAACAASSSPNPNAPIAVAARPALAPAMNCRRETSMFIGGSSKGCSLLEHAASGGAVWNKNKSGRGGPLARDCAACRRLLLCLTQI